MTAPASGPASWADLAAVTELTGVTVTAAQLAQAQSVIELKVGRTASVATTANMRETTKRWLRAAVAYQAAWMASVPDYFTRSNVSMVGARTEAIVWGPSGIELAPLARRALKRLGWKGTHSVQTPSTLFGEHEAYRPNGYVGIGPIYDYPGENWRSE